MPPLKAAFKKSSLQNSNENLIAKSMNMRNTRATHSLIKKENSKDRLFPKRKAVSPIKGNTLKRSALGNITNAIETQCVINSAKKAVKKAMTTTSTVTKPTFSSVAKKVTAPVLGTKKNSNDSISKLNVSNCHLQVGKSMLPPVPKSRLTLPLKAIAGPAGHPKPSLQSGTRLKTALPTNVSVKANVLEKCVTNKPAARQSLVPVKKPSTVVASKCKVTAKPKHMVCSVPSTRRSCGRRSTLDSTDSLLYQSALSEIFDDGVSPENELLPKPDINIDEEYTKDPFQCAVYAYEIFEYLKSREDHFRIRDYIEDQPGISQLARATLVDWMVEIQENFELNHETLYLGVKLMDSYLSRIRVSKESLQLVGATAILIAAKYDERIPPSIEDFIYICDGSYKRKEVTKMEVNILKIIDFQLGFPLSYRFLRRYARCAKVQMPLLTLARFILEYTLMDYSTVCLSDSKLAAAALYLAFKMKKEHEWDNTLIYFSGYRVKELIDIVYLLNNCLHQKPKQMLNTIRNKYSHKVFYEVAKIPLVRNEDL